MMQRLLMTGVALLISWTAAAAGPIYTIRDLGDISGPPCCGPFRINDNGTISGNLGPTAVALDRHATEYLWPGLANDINVSGQIAGLSEGQAVVWSDGKVRQLGSGAANAISNSGLVAGSSGGVGAMWDHSGALIQLMDLGATDSAAFGVNDFGHVVGTSRATPEGRYRAVEWVNFVVNELPTLCVTADCSSYASAINVHGHIVGASADRAVIWHDGTLFDIGTLGGPNSTSFAIDVNDHGWVVGDAPIQNAPTAAFVFDGTRMWDLNTLIVGHNPFTQLTVAQGINNQGGIVGVGFVDGKQHLFVASRRGRPVPEPSVFWLMAGGLFVLWWRGLVRRRLGAPHNA